MAIDLKYGKVTFEHGNIGEDEPVVVFRAKDGLLLAVLAHYAKLCSQAGSPTRHIGLIGETAGRVAGWQRNNTVKIPDSEASRKWMDH